MPLKQFLFFFVILFLLLSPLAGEEQIVNMVVCTVNGTPITLFDLKKQINPEHPESVSAESVYKKRTALMEEAVNKTLVDQELKRQKVSVTEADVDHAVTNIARSNNMTVSQLKAEVEKGGLSWNTYRNEVLRKQLNMLKLKQIIATKQLSVDDALLRDMYKKQYADTNNYTASHILIRRDDYMAIAKIRDEIVSGAISFEEAARKYSDDGSAAQGGSLGTFPAAAMVPEFSKVLRSMKPGEISQPFKSRFGWHIIKLDAITQGKAVPYEKVKMALLNQFYVENQQKAFDSWLKTQKSVARIVCFSFEQ